MLEVDYGFNTLKYDELFYRVIDSLIYLHFEVESAEVILFYLYDRVNPGGSINPFIDAVGGEIYLETVQSLWDLVQRIEIDLSKKSNAKSETIK